MNKQTIEILEGMIEEISNRSKTKIKPDVEVTIRITEEERKRKALSQAIQWGKALQSAEGELPEKAKGEGLANEQHFGFGRVTGFNQAIDLCKPILAKKELRIEALRKIRNHHFAKYEEQRYKTKKSEQELATLKKKLTESKKSL